MSPPGLKLKMFLQKKRFESQVDTSPLKEQIQEIYGKVEKNPYWNRKMDSECNLQHLKAKRRSAPGSYRRILRKNVGTLFFDTKSHEVGKFNRKFEGNFVVIARKRERGEEIQPIIQYSQKCMLCKSNLVKTKYRGKPWRKSEYMDKYFKK